MARQRLTRIPPPHVYSRGAPGLVMGPCIVEIDRIFIRDVQYKFELIQCRNEEVNRPTRLVMGPCIVEIYRIVIRDVQYIFEVIRCRNEVVNEQVARTDGQTDITTISPLFLRKAWK
ncbi:hypothetical protein DPMN_061352 [Dreissena polymorpha]|uniref:Uncharacterized protein n=1 Tax=Dreissena polymorpha TaxID=45954 RepID=A0A9D4HH24_DREPO|nr:hypothetical protein DPMN_061352 [Dreissena polymorpha]